MKLAIEGNVKGAHRQHSKQDATSDGARHLGEFDQSQVGVRRVDVDHHVANGIVRLQVLRRDVDAVVGEDLVDYLQHARHVAADVQQRCLPGWAGSATSGKLTDDVDVSLSLYFTSFSATSTPKFSCASIVEPPTCGVRIDVVELPQWRLEHVLVAAWLGRKNVERRTQQLLLTQGR